MAVINYSYNKGDNSTDGLFRINYIPSCGIYVDFKFRAEKISCEYVLFRCMLNEITVCENKLKLSKQMGQYIELPAIGEYHFSISAPVEIVSITMREVYNDFGNILECKSDTTLRNYYSSIFQAEKLGLSLTWFVTWLCNYKCPYCWERVDETKYRKQTGALNSINPMEWAKGFNELNPMDIYFTGGEPTIYKDLPIVMDMLNESIRFKMTTNFGDSFNLEEYSRHIKEGRFSVLGISFHPSEVSLDIFLNKVSKTLEIGINDKCDFGIEMVLYPDDLKYANDLISFAEQNQVKLMLDNFNDPLGKYKPSEEEMIKIAEIKKRAEEHNYSLKTNKSPYFIDFDSICKFDRIVICGAGKNGDGIVCKMKTMRLLDKVMCLSDVKSKNQIIHGKPVMRHYEAAQKFPDATFIISVANINTVLDIVAELSQSGVSKNKIKIFRENPIQKTFKRTSEPIWCPAGMNVIHVDPTGDAYPCMRAIAGMKKFGEYAMPHYHSIGNILDGTVKKGDVPIPCWESHRCSRCDWELIDSAMRNMDLKEGCYLPLP